MKITISRRSKSYNSIPKLNDPRKLMENQQSAERYMQASLKKTHSLNKKTNEQQHNICTKWLLQRCLKSPSIVDEELFQQQSISIHQTKELPSISVKHVPKMSKKIEDHQKIKLTFQRNNTLISHPESFVQSTKISKDKPNVQQLTKNVYLEQKKCLGSEQNKYLLASRNEIGTDLISSYKNRAKQMDFSFKPSTVVSSNNSYHQGKGSTTKKLKLSNHFISIMQSQKMAFEKKHIQQIVNEHIKKPSQDAHDDHLSRYEIVYPSQNEFKIQDPYKSNFSINTSDIRKRIQFSSELSDRAKLENYVYEPVYSLDKNHIDFDSPNLNNYKSQFIKNIQVQNQDLLNSAKLYSQQSMVLQKGREQILLNHGSMQYMQYRSRQNDEECFIDEKRSNNNHNSKSHLTQYEKIDEILEN